MEGWRVDGLTADDRSPVVYDTGALLAAERNDRRFLVVHWRFLEKKRELILPSPVLAQAWRGGSRQATLGRVLKSCAVEPTSEATARNAGVILGLSRTSDAIDAIVVATAIAYNATIVTTDPDDIGLLWGASGTKRKLALISL
jgi:predicted nucleic acid-binding protein